MLVQAVQSTQCSQIVAQAEGSISPIGGEHGPVELAFQPSYGDIERHCWFGIGHVLVGFASGGRRSLAVLMQLSTLFKAACTIMAMLLTVPIQAKHWSCDSCIYMWRHFCRHDISGHSWKAPHQRTLHPSILLDAPSWFASKPSACCVCGQELCWWSPRQPARSAKSCILHNTSLPVFQQWRFARWLLEQVFDMFKFPVDCMLI